MKFEEKMKTMNMRKKLNVYGGIMVCVICMIGVICGILTYSMNVKTKEVIEVWVKALNDTKELDNLTSDYRLTQYSHLAATDEEMLQEREEMLISIEKQIHACSAQLDETITYGKVRELYEDIAQKWSIYQAKSAEVLQKSREGKKEEGQELMLGEIYDVYNDFSGSFSKLAQCEQELANAAEHSAYRLLIVMFVAITASIIIGIGVAIQLSRILVKTIMEPVKQITEAAVRLYQGDMSAGELITYESEDELGIVADSLRGAMKTLKQYIEEISSVLYEIAQGNLTKDSNEITDFSGDFKTIKESFVYILKRFNTTLTDIQVSSERVAVGSADLSGASHSLSDGATEQAGALEELTSTVATVTSLAEESAKRTQEAYDNIQVSVKQAEQQKEKMIELTEEMKRMTDISREIEHIIEDIEEIASQTNLLALNASIEAARAGDAGRGFSVVADQIGKLAKDSATSAENTRKLIHKTLDEIDQSNAIAASSATAFDLVIQEMVTFAQVARTTNENVKNQAYALEQVEEGIDQISAGMQNTASASEECTIISENLSEQASRLDTLVKTFSLFKKH